VGGAGPDCVGQISPVIQGDGVWLYYVPVQKLPQTVLEFVRRHGLLKAGDRVAVAVSGGADSVALLRLLLELRSEIGIVLSVVHFNHKLRGAESDEDQHFVAELAERHKLEQCHESGDVAGHAVAKHLSLETAARDMRYQFFRQLLRSGRLNRIATGHTLDDQAETVLLKMVRGAGGRGLAGIYPLLPVSRSQLSAASSRPKQYTDASIIRPLLATRRCDLELHLLALGQSWREDKSNRDVRHMRNRVRHGILPRLERYLNPAVREALAETAEIARAEEQYWARELTRALPLVTPAAKGRLRGNREHAGNGIDTLTISALLGLPLALQRRVIRAAGESLGLQLDFYHVEGILALCSNRGGSLALGHGWVASRKKNELWFEPSAEKPEPSPYEYRLSVPGFVDVPETESRFEAVLVSGNAAEDYNPGDLLAQASLAAELKVRNWRPGDRFQPAHRKAAKKIKELLQERRVTGEQRKFWPVIVSGLDVVWVRGFPPPTQLRPGKVGDKAVSLRETTLKKTTP
jgi:tRNA(Ile)-lysidine synthase